MKQPLTVNRGEMVFYFKPESIIMEYRGAHYAFHCYSNLREIWRLKMFGERIMGRELTLEEVFSLSRKLGVSCDQTSSASKQIISGQHSKMSIQWT
jgi:hypothetical protein